MHLHVAWDLACTPLPSGICAGNVRWLRFNALHVQGGNRQLDGVKLSKKDAEELRDLMPTDDNLLDTCMLQVLAGRSYLG